MPVQPQVGAQVKHRFIQPMFFPLCYNSNMMLKDEVKAYQARWEVVEEIQREERRSASLALRWQQLNAAVGIAKVLGLFRPDSSELEVFERWARLKEKATNLHPKA